MELERRRDSDDEKEKERWEDTRTQSVANIQTHAALEQNSLVLKLHVVSLT